ncbi:MAG: glycosyltransferase N-terminal domain-containing protein [Planctomycetota bacterium]
MGLGRDIAYGLGAAAAAPLWATSMLRTGKWRTDWPGRFGHVPDCADDKASATERKTLLIHGVSVGEVNLVRGLVAELEPAESLELVISSTTNTGTARAEALYGDRHRVVRFPLDFSFAVRRFLDAVRPDAVALVELEVWPNFMEACERRGVPVAVINGRLSERSYRGYRRFRPLVAPSFGKLAAAAVQDDAYAERFVGLGAAAERVHVFDTMKWDAADLADAVDGADALAEAMGIDRSRPLVVAGSTAPGEDDLLIRTRPPEVQLLIAPRKPEWFDAVTRHAPDAVRRTTTHHAARPPTSGGDVFLLDTIGELRAAYSLADVCVVGRSFTGELYGSDMVEPIALGKPTVVGPHFRDFADTMKALTDAGGIVVSDDPMGAATELLNNPTLAAEVAASGREVIRSRRGATPRHAALLRNLLGLATPPT